MEKELLQQALNSILHGSSLVITEQDGYGNMTSRTVQVNDLRIPLVNKLAEKLANTDAFQEALSRALTHDVIKKVIDGAIATAKISDLPYRVRNELEKQMSETRLEVRKYTLVAEVVEPTP